MNALFYLLITAINIYQFILIVTVIMSLLINFGVINTYNQFVSTVYDILLRLTEPVLRPIRNMLPNLGGIDISPLIVLVLLGALKVFIVSDIAPRLGAYAY